MPVDDGRETRAPEEKGAKIMGIGPKLLGLSDWHQDCYFKGTDGHIICDPFRSRRWQSKT